MLVILSSQLFDLCSPTVTDYYTYKFPQLMSQQEWWTKSGSIFQNNPASPFSSQIYLSQNTQKILIVGTSQEYLDKFLANINKDIKDYLEIKQLLISENITIADYFQKLDDIHAHDFDLIALPLINCKTHDKQQQLTEVLYDRTNKFYLAKNWTKLQGERVQSSEQIQAILEGYQKFNKLIISMPVKYKNFTLQQISGNSPLLLTSIIDTTQSLQYHSITFCHISPYGQIQSSIKDCQVAIPIGMQTSGIRGSGNIGDAFQFIIKFLSQIDTKRIDLLYLFAVIKDSIRINKANLKQQYKAPFGFTNFISIQEIIKLNEVSLLFIRQDIIMRQNVKNGDLLDLGQFRIFQIRFTIRGHEDTFEPLYSNNYKISLNNNGEDMLPFEGIHIYTTAHMKKFGEQIDYYILKFNIYIKYYLSIIQKLSDQNFRSGKIMKLQGRINKQS